MVLAHAQHYATRVSAVARAIGATGDAPLSGGCTPRRVGQRWTDYAVGVIGVASAVSVSVVGRMVAVEFLERYRWSGACHSSGAPPGLRRPGAAGRGVGDADASVRRLISLFSGSSGCVDRIFFHCANGNSVKGQQVVFGVAQKGLRGRELAAQHAGDGVELTADVFGVEPGEDPDRRSHYLGVALGARASTLR